jgi:acetylglutamate kinase
MNTPAKSPAMSPSPIGIRLPEGVRVIKIGGRVQRDDRLGPTLSAWWRVHTRALCVVHGGGDDLSTLQRALGIEPTFIAGRRVTAPEDIDLVRMALSGAANKRLVDMIIQAGVPAVGISGEDATLLSAEVIDGGALGAVGRVRGVNTHFIATLWAAGYLPVISPLASPGLNVNGDDAAAAIAVALKAEELLLIADVPGVRLGGEGGDGGRCVTALDEARARDGLASGEIAGGMEVKVRAALTALDGGVRRVRIGGLGTLIGSEAGTKIRSGPRAGVAA